MEVATGQTAPPRILVVDDEPELLDELQESLRVGGWDVAAASDAAMAWEKLDADDGITVVLSDIRMPGMDGLSLAKRICDRRGDSNATEVVLLTGHGTLNDAAEAVRIGAFDFLSKPITLKALLDATRKAHEAASEKRRAEAARTATLNHLNADRDRLESKIAATEVLLLDIAERAQPVPSQHSGTPAAITSDRGSPEAPNLDAIDLSQSVPREFSRILSYEMRTPLAALMAVPELLGGGLELSAADVADNLAIVRNAGARLAAIADDFVELLTPVNDRKLQYRKLEPAVVLSRVKGLMESAATAATQRIEESDTAGGEIETDPIILANALGRLVANAIAWNPPEHNISLSVYTEAEGEVTFEVGDRGPGMSEAELTVAQQPFRQLDMSLTRSVSGLGLGLPLVDRAARLLGGRLRLNSTPGRGTKAAIIMPRHARPGRPGNPMWAG